jgi:hypothetical protein
MRAAAAPSKRDVLYTALAVIGCSLASLAATTAACNPPPVVDVAPSSLDAKVSIIDTDPTPSDHKIIVAVQFFTGGNFVQLAGNSTVACNGTALPWNGLGYMARVPIMGSGSSYVIQFTRNGSTTQFSVPVQARPVITSPAAGATVTRSSNLVIAYQPGGSSTVTGVRGGASGRQGSSGTSTSGNDQPDDGTYEGLNVSSFDAGSGSLDLTKHLTPTPSSSSFHAVEVKYDSGNHRAVTWQ